MRFALTLRELEEIQRPLDVHVVRGHRREFRSGRQQRSEMEHAIDLEFGQDSIEQRHVGDRSKELARHARRQRCVERIHVDGDDRHPWR